MLTDDEGKPPSSSTDAADGVPTRVDDWLFLSGSQTTLEEPVKLEIQDRSQIECSIAGALKNAIDAHGAIDRSEVGSAVKRVYRELCRLAREQMEIERLRQNAIEMECHDYPTME